jgi:hypothetical protein
MLLYEEKPMYTDIKILLIDDLDRINLKDVYYHNVTENSLEPINCVKIVLDETTGQLLPGQADLDDMVFRIHESGKQAAIHAIEENAIESSCNAIEKALKRTYPGRITGIV